MSPNSSFDKSVEMSKIRNIGHLLLLRSGNTDSRVKTEKLENERSYKIEFEANFKPNTDSLILISQRELKDYGAFTVELWEDKINQPVYSFVVSQVEKDNVLPCGGRPLPAKQYSVLIRFEESGSEKRNIIIAGLGLLVAISGFIFFKRQTKASEIKEETAPHISLGNMQFHVNRQQLFCNGEVIELTAKEAQVLKLLSETPNEVVERARLQKEIWEDQGVVVGRSLDIFISRLRKKLSANQSVKITNLHGRGYMLSIETDDED